MARNGAANKVNCWKSFDMKGNYSWVIVGKECRVKRIYFAFVYFKMSASMAYMLLRIMQQSGIKDKRARENKCKSKTLEKIERFGKQSTQMPGNDLGHN